MDLRGLSTIRPRSAPSRSTIAVGTFPMPNFSDIPRPSFFSWSTP